MMPINFLDTLLAKENWQLIKQEGHQVMCHKSHSLRCYLHLTITQKNLWYQLILSTDIDYQKILKSDWTQERTGQTQPQVVVTDATFP